MMQNVTPEIEKALRLAIAKLIDYKKGLINGKKISVNPLDEISRLIRSALPKEDTGMKDGQWVGHGDLYLRIFSAAREVEAAEGHPALYGYGNHSIAPMLTHIDAAISIMRSVYSLDVITASEAVTRYGLAESTVRQAINRGQIPAWKSGETWLLKVKDAEDRWARETS